MKILVFGAHPDDIEFGMAGTVLKLVQERNEVAGVVLTHGEMGTRGDEEKRKTEAKNSAEILGYRLEMLDFQDTRIDDTDENRTKIANIIRKYAPDVVFAPFHTNKSGHKDGIAHFDHTNTGLLVKHSLRLAKFEKARLQHNRHLANQIVYYMVPRFHPPTFVNDVSSQFNKMLEAMRAHESQIDDKLLDMLVTMRKYYGFMIGAQYGEAFVIEDPAKFNIQIFSN